MLNDEGDENVSIPVIDEIVIATSLDNGFAFINWFLISVIKVVELCKEISEWDEQKKKILFYKSMTNTTHNYELLASFYANKKMRSNFWHEFRDKKLFPIK